MPLGTRWFIKASLIYLLVALALSVLIATGAFASLNLRPVFLHFFLVGWVTQIIMGVAYWFLPKYSREQPRRNERLALATFWLLNTGLILRGVAEPLFTQTQAAAWAIALLASAVFQWLAATFFVVNIWGRVKER